METFVFSHRRGRFLANLLRSIESAEWRGPVTIIDDGSSDRRTLTVLRGAERLGHTVLRRERTIGGKWGGLQESMASALSLARGPVTLFIQDDMQFVRPIGLDEVRRIERLLLDPRNSPFAFPAFHLESWKASRNAAAFEFVPRIEMPVRGSGHPLRGYSEVSMFAPERLRQAGWDPRPNETDCSPRAFHAFGPMISYPYPFVAFVPFPNVPRRGFRFALRNPKRLPWPAKLRVMSDVEVEALFASDPARIPLATEHLSVASTVRAALIGRDRWEG